MEAPRVNATMLPQYSGKLVCLVGEVTEISSTGTDLKIMTCDQKVVQVALGERLDEQLQGVVEIIGRVQKNGSLSSQRIIPYSVDFDLNLYAEALSLTSNFSEMFGSSHSNGFGY